MQKMVTRYQYLFPKEVQPQPPSSFLFIPKEVRHIIRPFDYSKLNFTDSNIPPDTVDQEVIEKLNQLDTLVMVRADYNEFESLITEIKDGCERRFQQWLIAKGVEANSEDFADCPLIFIDFIYGYLHDDDVILKTVTDRYWLEFFEDFLIRKMMLNPPDYVFWPPALKLFYRFLYDKGYLGNPDKIIAQIDQIEPYFIKVLKHQFS